MFTDGLSHALTIQSKPSGFGSSVNGGELLALALATCYCNDLYREAVGRGIDVDGVEVTVDAVFGAAGEPATRIDYRVVIRSPAPPERVRELAIHTDQIAEIQNTLRLGMSVRLVEVDIGGAGP